MIPFRTSRVWSAEDLGGFHDGVNPRRWTGLDGRRTSRDRCVVMMGHPRRCVYMWFLVVLGVSCHRSPTLCPEGMQPWKGRSGPGLSIWCKGADGHAAAWIELYNAKEPRMICQYRQSVPDGPFRAFHPTSVPWIEGAYARGLKQGHWRQWDK